MFSYIRKLKLCEYNDNFISFNDIEKMVGSSTTEADRVKAYREKQKLLKVQKSTDDVHSYENRTQPEQQSYPEKEIEKEIEIEIEKERERELDTGQPARAAYGRYENVFLSQSELDGLKADLPGKWNYYIDRLSCHIASSGKQYRSHAATIYKWAQEDAARKAPKKGIPDYSCKEGESL